MARARHVFILALVLFNIIVLASAAEAPKSSSNDPDADDEYEDMIGTDEGSAASPNSVVAGPIGGPVPPGAFDDTKAAAPSAASSSLHHFSAVVEAVTAIAIAGFIYF